MFPPNIQFTGTRLERLLAVVKNLPKKPDCGCVIWSEAARNIFEALVKEQIDVDMGIDNGKQTEEKATDAR